MIHSSQEQLARLKDILSRLDEHIKKDEKENRRRLPRVAMRFPLGISLMTGHAPSTVEIFTRNISGSGMGFVSRRLFRPEERIVIPFRIPKLPHKMVLARITFGRYLQAGLYEMGSEFLEAAKDLHGKAQIPVAWLHNSGASPAASSN
ncbi:MAG TPA: PilZ domain-containing protein [Phycisphaerae bacterium]|nr:PilZ domain-containing protein [Phycisphaerae bacterium]